MRLDDFIGIPYVEKGRTLEGCDCWGLLVLVYDRYFKIKVPSFSDDYQGFADREGVDLLLEQHRNEWVQVESPHIGDGVFMILQGRPHVGIYIGDDRILHTSKGFGSIIERTDSVRLRNRIQSFHRFQHE